MITIQQMKDYISNEITKRDFIMENTPEYKEIKEEFGDTFEAVLTGNGKEKCLIPNQGTLFFLYRGQNKEYKPCVPSLYRGNPTDGEIFVERMRYVLFRRLLQSHPAVKYFFNRHHFKVDVEGLAQHYGLKTSVLDLTSDMDIALFFATCWYDVNNDCYHYYDDGREHEGIMYVFSPILDNEPCPSFHYNKFLNSNIRPIGLQAFPRPGVQKGYGLHISRNDSVKCYLYRFRYTCEESKYYYDKFKQGELLWIKDKLINKTSQIILQKEFSFDVFNETFCEFRPKGYSKTRLKKALPNDIKLRKKSTDILFNDKEKEEIIEEWNNSIGPDMAAKIYRRSWFHFEGMETESDGSQRIVGKYLEHEYRTVERICYYQMLLLIAAPDRLEGAEWVNYTDKPRPYETPVVSDWHRVPASMEAHFGSPYLKEDDWRIPYL